jgi:hypothetical protein
MWERTEKVEQQKSNFEGVRRRQITVIRTPKKYFQIKI